MRVPTVEASGLWRGSVYTRCNGTEGGDAHHTLAPYLADEDDRIQFDAIGLKLAETGKITFRRKRAIENITRIGFVGAEYLSDPGGHSATKAGEYTLGHRQFVDLSTGSQQALLSVASFVAQGARHLEHSRIEMADVED